MSDIVAAQSVTHQGNGAAEIAVSPAAARIFLAQLGRNTDIIPPYATDLNEVFLRNILLQPEYGLLKGAVSIQKTKFAAADWYCEGGTEKEREFMQTGLEYRSLGGFTQLRALLARDFFSQNKGAFAEVLDMSFPDDQGGKRAPLRPPAVGLAHLDAGLCALTRNPEWPVIYNNPSTGARHILHYSRVIHLVDDPNAAWEYAGWGECAVSRAIQRARIASRQGILELERMEDLPPGSLLLLRNAHWDDVVARYEQQREQKGNDVYRDVLVIEGIDSENPVEIDVVRFRSLPEEYDPTGSFLLTMLIFALVWGTDVRDFTTISGGELGSAAETIVKHAKSRMLGAAYFRRIFVEGINARYMTGTNVRFALREQDDEQEQIRAETQNIQAETFGKAYERGGLKPHEYRAALNKIGVLPDEALEDEQEETEVTEAESSDRARQMPSLSQPEDYEIGPEVIADVLAWWETIPELRPYLPQTEAQENEIPTGNGDPEIIEPLPRGVRASLFKSRQSPQIPESARQGLSQVAIDAFKRDARALTARLAAGDIAIDAWQTEARTLIRRAYVTQTAIGKGGWSNVTRSDWGRVGAMLSSRTGGQYGFLDQFARDIVAAEAAGNPISEAKIGARLEMYGDSSRQSLAAADAVYRGILPSELPALPGDGTTLCLSKCKCNWTFEPVGEGMAAAYWELGIADHCQTCVWRAENWAPWGVVQQQELET